ncbi:MFS general substrate transporter [Polyporus arcularius HHB13444]|uniref:MFS general substrate transporter n=1 Tax=Polyporus arcularius HHB13444 TaxID=1314778 RepID=A0A5C3PAG1_9APHY|nr:MFS general substrate transporter [Polyporus arcularius HHB13444]
MSVIADESTPATSEKHQADASEDADVSLGPDTVIYGGEDKLPPPPDLTAGEERRLWRKIDMRFMPTMTMLYLVSFLDRSNIGNAKLEGLVTQLNLTGTKYNIALTLYFVAFNVFPVPANLLIKRLRPSRWLSSITIVWGIITTLMGLVKTYPQLVGVRVCLGVAEAGLGCGVFYTLSLWYPRFMLQTRIAMFWAGATFAGAFSGLVAYGISFMSGTGGLLGWSWIFILEGLFTIIVGIFAFFVLPDLPDTAQFLTLEERAFVVHKKKYDNSSVGEQEHFEWRHVKEALLDWQVWALCTINATVTTPIYGIAFFLPTIINGFGFNTTISQLLTVPVYLVAVIMVMVWGVWSDHVQMRAPFVFAGLALSAIGYGINISNASIGAKYFGTFLVAIGGYASFPAINAWVPNNTSGHYKRAVALGVLVTFGNFGGIISGNVYRLQDEPRYRLGHALELLFIGIGLVLTPIVTLTYWKINRKREMLMQEAREKGITYDPDELRRLGDRAPDFRYVL